MQAAQSKVRLFLSRNTTYNCSVHLGSALTSAWGYASKISAMLCMRKPIIFFLVNSIVRPSYTLFRVVFFRIKLKFLRVFSASVKKIAIRKLGVILSVFLSFCYSITMFSLSIILSVASGLRFCHI